MPRYCKNSKCKKEFPIHVVIDGQPKNLSSRKYCLDCSPFGQNGSTTVRLLEEKKVKKVKKNTKRCTNCNKVKKISEFYKHAGRANRHSKCKTCFNSIVYDRMMRRKIQAIKHLGGKCVDCGYNKNPAVFDFHHKNPKKKDLGISRITGRSWNKIKIELDKCTLLCSNCHRIRHSPFISNL